MISTRRIKAIAKKEKAHILRDPFTLLFALGMPLFLVAVFGTAIDFDVKNIHLSIDDRDKTQASREFIQVMKNTGVFKTEHVAPAINPESFIRSERSKGIIVIEPEFERHKKVQIIIDGADNSIASSILGYLISIQERLNPPGPIKIKTRFLYNPELSSHYFVVPGLSVVVLAIVSILLTALTVARDWENGPMEQLLSTPARPVEIIIGKITPYVLIGIISVSMVYLLARFGFSVPFLGSHLIFVLACVLFLTASLAQGILISVITRKQVISMQLSMISGLIPSLLLSGFIFPIESMPTFFHYFTMILPARWFMEISRDVFLKGSSFFDLKISFLALSCLCIALIGLATVKFKKDLEP